MNRLVSVKDSDGQTTTYEHDVLGNVTKQENPNGETTDYTYDIMGQKTSSIERLGDVVTRENRYEYDLLGNVTKETQKADYAPLNKTKTYVYDSTSQLLKATENGSTSEYSYDNFGNLAKEVVSGREIIYNYNNLNQLVGKTAESDSYSYSYDQRGNLVSETKNGAVVKTYTYNAENKMVKGENKDTGEASEYEYNALGYRTALTQKKKNGNTSFANNLNSFGNNYSEFVQEIAKKDSDIEQKTFDDVLGLTRQLLLPTVKTEFVADYTSYAKVDLVAYENGSYTTTYTYGENDEKISQSVSHHVGLTDVLEGKNPLTQIATTNIKKAYYHKTRQGSTAYVTDKDGQVLAFTEYDAWGKMETQKPSTMNFAGLDDITDYTGHTYDEVLEKHFAQARFYDAVNRRFVTEDPVKDGLNWYVYVGNNPINYVDPTGKYYILRERTKAVKERGLVISKGELTGYYFVERDSKFYAVLNSPYLYIPLVGSHAYADSAPAITDEHDVITGSSVQKPLDREEVLKILFDAARDKLIKEALKKMAESGVKLIAAAGEIGGKSFGGYQYIKIGVEVQNRFEKVDRDIVLFQLIDMFGLPKRSTDFDSLNRQMLALEALVDIAPEYFFVETLVHFDTIFEIDRKLYFSSASEQCKIIKSYSWNYAANVVSDYGNVNTTKLSEDMSSYLRLHSQRIYDLKNLYEAIYKNIPSKIK